MSMLLKDLYRSAIQKTKVGPRPGDDIEEAGKHHISVVASGYMTSDPSGMNLFAERIEARCMKATPFSGSIRVKRS